MSLTSRFLLSKSLDLNNSFINLKFCTNLMLITFLDQMKNKIFTNKLNYLLSLQAHTTEWIDCSDICHHSTYLAKEGLFDTWLSGIKL